MADYNKEFDSDINFPKLVFLHINRILLAINDPPAYISAVEAFEDLLTYYIDETYKNGLGEYEKALEEASREDGLTKDKPGRIQAATVDLSRAKFRGLMKTAGDKGLLLEKVGYGFDEGLEDIV